MLKSLTAAAELPYFPISPTPTLASSIIPTSLPPSPIAKTTKPSFSFTNRTITAFYLGELLQKITDFARESSVAKNMVSCERTQAICLPQITSVKGRPSTVSLLNSSQYFWGYQTSTDSRKTLQFYRIRWERYPIFSAVSNLSPVTIITLISACCSRLSVIGTSSCSLSQMPVAPIISKLVYKQSTKALYCPYAYYLEIMRYLNWYRILYFSAKQCLISLGESTFLAKTSVLRPSLANPSTFLLNFYESEYQCDLSKMAESAPFVKRVTLFFVEGSRTTTLILFLLLKGTTSINSTLRLWPQIYKQAHFRARPPNLNPNDCAQLTKHTSSGEEP